MRRVVHGSRVMQTYALCPSAAQPGVAMRLCEVHCRSTAVPRSRVVLAARQGDRPGRGGGGGGDAPPPRYFTPPERLLSTGPAQVGGAAGAAPC